MKPASISVVLVTIACSANSTHRTDGGAFGTASQGMASVSGSESAGPSDSGPGTDGGSPDTHEGGQADTHGGGSDTNEGGPNGDGHSSTGSPTGVDSSGSDGGVKFDTPVAEGGATAEGGGANGECGCGNMDWSYVWIANSFESTVSKINTRTMVEEGRYLTRADANGNPSRTSVSIDGRAVAVANRHTGIVKIWARPEFCSDQNGTPGIQTSSGGLNVLPWGQDDCVAWYADFSDKTVQRPVQWTPGVGPCHENQKVWTTTGSGGMSPGYCGDGGVWVHRLNGDTGVVEDTIPIEPARLECSLLGSPGGLGPYGGAVDHEGNFWFHIFGIGPLVRVDFDTLDVEIFAEGGGYGITVDTKARAWMSGGMRRFDYATNTWAYQSVSQNGGIAQDLQQRIWAAAGTGGGVVWVDMETLAVGGTVMVPGGQVKGVSVDIDGYIWAVPQGTVAHKIDPNTFAFTTFSGLGSAYTYSDMTGGALANVTCNPPAD